MCCTKHSIVNNACHMCKSQGGLSANVKLHFFYISCTFPHVCLADEGFLISQSSGIGCVCDSNKLELWSLLTLHVWMLAFVLENACTCTNSIVPVLSLHPNSSVSFWKVLLWSGRLGIHSDPISFWSIGALFCSKEVLISEFLRFRSFFYLIKMHLNYFLLLESEHCIATLIF